MLHPVPADRERFVHFRPRTVFVVIGISHRTPPLEVREKLAFTDDAVGPAVRELGALPSIAEAVLLSTCNRVEIYAATRGANYLVIDSFSIFDESDSNAVLTRARLFCCPTLARASY